MYIVGSDQILCKFSAKSIPMEDLYIAMMNNHFLCGPGINVNFKDENVNFKTPLNMIVPKI